MSISRYCYRYSLFSHFILYFVFLFFFFFQAEDGIRDKLVTGVQTCALPILVRDAEGYVTENRYSMLGDLVEVVRRYARGGAPHAQDAVTRMDYDRLGRLRSEERRVGKECRCRWSPDH